MRLFDLYLAQRGQYSSNKEGSRARRVGEKRSHAIKRDRLIGMSTATERDSHTVIEEVTTTTTTKQQSAGKRDDQENKYVHGHIFKWKT